MKRFKLAGRLILFATVATISFFVIEVGNGLCAAMGAGSKQPTMTLPVVEWKKYHNEKSGYKLEYPDGWTPGIAMVNVEGERYVIREEVMFSDQITVAVWDKSPDINLSEWFAELRYWIAGEGSQVTSCTATLLNTPTICVYEPPTRQSYEEIKYFLENNSHIYRVKYTISDDAMSIEIFQHMISTFQFE